MTNQRWALGLEYDGSGFQGWQFQREGSSVQAAVEQALSLLVGERVVAICAGRTDAGVHALNQVVHFDVPPRHRRSESVWTFGANRHLPPAVRVSWARAVPPQFHARHSALERIYVYWIDNAPTRPALWSRRVTWLHRPLDAAAMHHAAQAWIGEHDFSSFRAQSCQSKSARRCVHSIEVMREGQYIGIRVQANAFLHHMVRNMVGSLIWIGWNRKPVEWAAWLLRAQNRSDGGPTAPAAGLYLAAVRYPDAYQLPSMVYSLGMRWGQA